MSAFADNFAAALDTLHAVQGESITYVFGESGMEREVSAIVERNPVESLAGGEAEAPMIRVKLRQIEVPQVDSGIDRIKIDYPIGSKPKQREVIRVVGQDHAQWVVECR